MVLKRQIREGVEEGSQLPFKRALLVANILKGLNYGRSLQGYVPSMEPIITKWVEEAVDRGIDQYMSPSYNHVEFSGLRNLQLQFHSTLPQTVFTGSRVLSEDQTPIRVVLCNSISKRIITCGPLSTLKVTIVVLHGDFGPDDWEDWTTQEFDNNMVKNREGKRPLVTGGGLIVDLLGGVGHIGEIRFTDNSSWTRSGKFRFGAKVDTSSNEISFKEARSNAFKVKDHRGEFYSKHHSPSLGDDIWRWVEITRDGVSHKRNLQLQFHNSLPQTLFTGSRVLSEDKTPIRVVLYDSSSKRIITSGPLSSLKVTIVVLNGDFGPNDPEDWTTKEFNNKIVKNREGKRPLLTGELMVNLQGGVGHIGEISFTDNSSWIRSGKFRLGAKVNASSDEISIGEATSNAFKVKDHRGKVYQKHYPPFLDDEVWRLEKIAKDGASHKRLTQFGINNVRDFLRLYVINHITLRTVLNVSKKAWETIIGHATKCTLDDEKYMYRPTQGTGLLFNSIYEVVGATFDGENYQSVNSLNMYHKRMVEELKQHAYKNLKEWVSVSDPSVAGFPMLLASPAADSFTHPNFGLHGVKFRQRGQHETDMNMDHPTVPSYKSDVQQDNFPFELAETSDPMQSFIPTFRNSLGMNNSPGGLYTEGHETRPSTLSELSTNDLLIEDNLLAESSRLILDPINHFSKISSNSGIRIPGNQTAKTMWRKVRAVLKLCSLWRRVKL